MDAHRLDTARLTLRRHTLEDFDALAALWGDAAVTRFIGGKPSTREEAWARLLRYAGHWQLLGYGFWVVADKTSGAFLGEVGLLDGKRDLDPPFGDAVEVGWVMSPSAQGRGLATEAVRAVLAWADAHLPGRRVVCMIEPDNAASLRVAGKCGFVEYARTVYHDAPMVLLAIRDRTA